LVSGTIIVNSFIA